MTCPPENILRPKIVTPHRILLSRFSLDEKGYYATSRSPLMYPKETSSELELLRYFLAVLNSSVSFWQIVNLSHKYSHGYSMLEPKTLRLMRIPEPTKVSPPIMKKIQSLVKQRLGDWSTIVVENELDLLVAELYGLSKPEREKIGMEE